MLALLLAGCAVTSQRPPAEPPAPAAFQGSSDWQRVPADVQVPEAWWTLFKDPVLDRLQSELIVGNQNLASALAQVRSARAVLAASQSAIFPTLSLGAGTTRSATAENANGQRTVATSNSLTANASWEIDLWGRLAEGVKAAGASYQASEADLAALRLSAQATLTQSYFSLRTAEAQQALLERTVAATQRTLELTQARYASGVVAQSDVLQARTQLRSVQAQLSDLRTQRAQLLHALAAQLGQLPGQFQLPASAALPELPPVPMLVPSLVLAQRPDLAAARARQVAAYAQIGIADAAFLPERGPVRQRGLPRGLVVQAGIGAESGVVAGGGADGAPVRRRPAATGVHPGARLGRRGHRQLPPGRADGLPGGGGQPGAVL